MDRRAGAVVGVGVSWLLAAFVLAGLAVPALAINKCVGADGRVTYTDETCSAGSRGSRIDAPPPTSSQEAAEARARGERMVGEAQVLEARQAAESAERQRRYEAERVAEVARQNQQNQQIQREEAESRATLYPVFVPRYRQPPVPPAPKPKPVPEERKALVRPYPFR